ncbi:hypothetical protein [Bradyrhizobium sp. BR 10289]|uniref:phage adaptor protein n=1 Tax=Bradyrhizobium sp. BR 10289 TaxID=2749993 RepID=UPI001C653E38|nr:hypothetical protein [Bradyrhizobium sp. BR 10289]MBW7970958.1 hypothetical protein [Bradyrhizobium sp. BR 10289]
MTLGDLKTQFKGLLNNTVVNNNSALVATFINQAIMRIQRELRVPFMEKQLDLTIPSGFTKLPIPSDLLELQALMVDRDGDGILEYELQRVDLGRVVQASEISGISPTVFARQGASWVLGPMPSVGSHVLIMYYAEFAALTDDTSENTCLKVAWDAVLYGALSFACDYLTDDRAERFETRYSQIMKQLQDQADADELTADAAVRPALRFDEDC